MLGTWQLILPETFRYVVFGIFKIDPKPPSDQCVIPGNIIPGIPVRPLPPGFISGGGSGQCSKKLERAFGKMQGQGSAVKNWRALPLGATLYLWENLSKLKGHALGVHVDRADRGTVGGYAPGVRWYSTGGTVVRYGGVRWYGTGVRSVRWYDTGVRSGGTVVHWLCFSQVANRARWFALALGGHQAHSTYALCLTVHR